MWFLYIQIFFFMCVAAALGAALAWWWLRRRFVDVTETHAQLTRKIETAISDGRVLKKEDVDASLAAALAGYKPPQPDFDPLRERLLQLEQKIAAPDPDMAGLKERIGMIEQVVSTVSGSIASLRSIHLEALDQGLKDVSAKVANIQMPDVDSVNSRVMSLAETVATNRPNLAPLEHRLSSLEQQITSIRIPEVDLGPVHSGLARLDLSLSELQPPEVDLRPLETRLARVEELLELLDPKDALTAVALDVSSLASEITSLSADFATLSSGLGGVAGEVSAVGQAVARIDIPEAPDLDPVHNRLAEIDASLADRFALVQDRIAATTPLNDALIATLAAIEADLEVVASRRGPDIEPVYAQLASLDSSIGTIRNELRSQTRLETLERRLVSIQETVNNPPAGDVTREDLTALEDRLTSIEYGITALHHMLRSRSDSIREAEPRARAEAALYETRTTTRTTRSISPAESMRRAEAIASARKPDDQANLLTHAAFGEGDDLAQIVGVGPILTELLHEVGVFYFWQIAEWTDEDVAYVDEKLLHFKGRIERDDWVGQAKVLAEMPGSAPRPEVG